MKISIKKNLYSGIFAVLFGAVMLITIPIFINFRVQIVTKAIPPDYLPKIVSWFMIICGALLIVQSLVFKKESIVEMELNDEVRTLLYIGLVLVFIFLFRFVGFLIAALVAIPLSLILMEDRSVRHYIIGEVLVLLVWSSFKFLLHVPLL